jgi:hypothetical protein
VLICDGFGTHETLEILEFCFANNIVLCRLPSHTSHKLQPCDIAVFAPLKAAYREQVERLERGGVNIIGKERFTSLFSPARVTYPLFVPARRVSHHAGRDVTRKLGGRHRGDLSNATIFDGRHKIWHRVMSIGRRVRACTRLSEAAKALTTRDHVRGISGLSTLLNNLGSSKLYPQL